MCTRKRAGPGRLLCALLFLPGIALPPGLCQNAEPRSSIRKETGEMDLLHDGTLRDETIRRHNWDLSHVRGNGGDGGPPTSVRQSPVEGAAEAEAASRADDASALLGVPQTAANASAPLRNPNVAAAPVARGRSTGNGGDRERKTRCGKRSRGRDGPEAVREAERRGRRGEVSLRRGNSASRNAVIRLRAKRRRGRKNRERKRGKKRSRENEVSARKEWRTSSKYRRRMNDAPGKLVLAKLDNRTANEYETRRRPYEATNGGNDSCEDDLATAPQDYRERSTTETTLANRRTPPRRGDYAGDVERELSKQLEREISRSGLDDSFSLEERILGSSYRNPTRTDYARNGKKDSSRRKDEKDTAIATNSLEDRARFGNSRYDAAKMLGYSRTEEDLPILDLENEVLARTLKDYNAYITSSSKLPLPPRRDEATRRKPTLSHAHEQPIRPGEIAGLADPRRTAGVPATSPTGRDARYDGDDTKGDLSCMNGTFLPAPLAQHALIKYVKSSVPGHEYLEADYECAPGFRMASATSRLLCRGRQWVGQVPRCKVKRGNEGACSAASCEHVCKETDGGAVCSCYEGFRFDGYRCIDMNECEENNGGCEYKCVNTPGSFRCECPKGMKQADDKFTCMDINECLLNNGHGPCQDTCRNLVGGYECSCEGLQDSVLSSDNHTCQDAGPCSVNNAGCSHTCLSTMGRVFCLCPVGFMLEDDWKTCQDVDECAVPDLQIEVCRYGCINTPGSYRCAKPTEVKDQPILDGPSTTCLPGYEAVADGACVDINECSVNNGGCREVCENTEGSFFCACDGDEKALSSDGKSCVDINNVACPPLNPAGRGYLICTRYPAPKPWRGRRRVTNRPGTKCFLKCPHGYQLHGEYELACRSDGTWDGPKHGECVRYSKPRLECPKDVIAELPPGRDEAFVVFDKPSTDLDWFRYVRSNPSWGTRLEANFKPGVHEISFFARHPVSKKQASCVLRIIVKGGEAPKVTNCPKDIEVTGKNGTAITWAEPIFTDNVKVTKISSNESPGRPFDVGGHKVEYEASDEAGWSSKCVFTVVLRQE